MRAGRGVDALHPNFVVGIGGSAGALPSYKALLEALPSDTGMAFVIISPMSPSAHNELALILESHTKMPVIVASKKMPIRRNHVYVIPSDLDLFIEDDTFIIISPRAHGQNQIDLFFISLAEAIGARAIGVVLSGYKGDATRGCKRIKEKGGITFAQDVSAEVPNMPLMAQDFGNVDFVMPPEKIAGKLKRLAAEIKT
ncbi:MAG: chemotaxis protein CheB [Burkholderiales bacterium]|nr:chemotaxis protein CheB [Bacteroidia bacterium]